MSTSATRDVLLAQGPTDSGKTYLLEQLLGAYDRPVIAVDATGEWAAHGQALDGVADLRQHLITRLEEGRPPDPILSIPDHSAEQLFRVVREWELGCTLLLDEVDLYMPNSGKTNEDLLWLVKRGRHVQGPDSDAAVSIVAGCHAGQDVDRQLVRMAAHVCFQQTEARAVGRVSKYLDERVDVTQLGEYQYVCGRRADRVDLPIGKAGAGIWRYDPDRGGVVKDGSFEQTDSEQDAG